MSVVYFVNGAILLAMAVIMLFDAVLFPQTASVFSEAALIVGLIGVVVMIATSTALRSIERVHTFLLTSSVWITAAIAGGVPLYLWQLSPVDALFESMSGITTTGSTVMSGLDTTPHGILIWRAILQGLGGLGFVVAAIALLPILKVGGMQLFQSESSDKGDKQLRTAAQFAFATLFVYLILQTLCAILYRMGGMSWFDAVTHALTTLSTGGYSNYDASFGHFDSNYLQWVCTLFMLLGSLPFAWYIRAWVKAEWQSEQITMLIATLGMVIALITLWLVLHNHVNFFDALRLTAFNVLSVVSTTGYATTDYTTWGPFSIGMFFFLTAIGGCTGSTAGGVKTMRWIILWRSIRAYFTRVSQPHAVTIIKYEGRPVSESVMNGVMSYFMFFLLSLAFLSIALGISGLDFLTSVSGALTALANVGPGVGEIIGPAGNFQSLGVDSKLIVIFGMYLGRLEIMTVLVLLSASFWRELRT